MSLRKSGIEYLTRRRNRLNTPRTLRGALRFVESMLTKQSYSADLWDILSAIRGPDSRNKRLKHATTTVIRSAAFPSRPCEERSFYSEDSAEKAEIRTRLFKNKEDFNHFRQHCEAAFDALDLKLFEENRGTDHKRIVGRKRQRRSRG